MFNPGEGYSKLAGINAQNDGHHVPRGVKKRKGRKARGFRWGIGANRDRMASLGAVAPHSQPVKKSIR
jgi:hypothetical protein